MIKSYREKLKNIMKKINVETPNKKTILWIHGYMSTGNFWNYFLTSDIIKNQNNIIFEYESSPEIKNIVKKINLKFKLHFSRNSTGFNYYS